MTTAVMSKGRAKIAPALLVLVILAAGCALPYFGGAYLLRLATSVMILGIAATSLNLLVGYGGMVSFGHAAFLGVGAYAVGILGLLGWHSAWLGLPVAMAAAALAAALIGALSLRATGVFFIMITLAFAQMIYYAIIAIAVLGGDNGLEVAPGSFGNLSLKHAPTLYYAALLCLIAVIWLCGRLVRSRFGRVLRGIKDNERRMISLGFPAYRYKLVAFIIAGGFCGLAGALYANLDAYASPEMVHWTMSGNLLVMLILGGVGTLFGPLLGAAVFQLLQDVISNYTKHWMLIFGPALLLIVLVSHRGVLGLFTARDGGS